MTKDELRKRVIAVEEIKKLRQEIVSQYIGGRKKTAEELVREIRKNR